MSKEKDEARQRFLERVERKKAEAQKSGKPQRSPREDLNAPESKKPRAPEMPVEASASNETFKPLKAEYEDTLKEITENANKIVTNEKFFERMERKLNKQMDQLKPYQDYVTLTPSQKNALQQHAKHYTDIIGQMTSLPKGSSEQKINAAVQRIQEQVKNPPKISTPAVEGLKKMIASKHEEAEVKKENATPTMRMK